MRPPRPSGSHRASKPVVPPLSRQTGTATLQDVAFPASSVPASLVLTTLARRNGKAWRLDTATLPALLGRNAKTVAGCTPTRALGSARTGAAERRQEAPGGAAERPVPLDATRNPRRLDTDVQTGGCPPVVVRAVRRHGMEAPKRQRVPPRADSRPCPFRVPGLPESPGRHTRPGVPARGTSRTARKPPNRNTPHRQISPARSCIQLCRS